MNKIAIITGAIGGIGSAITVQLIKEGYKVIATYHSGHLEKAAQWYQQNEFKDHQIELLELDVTNTEDCKDKLNKVLSSYENIDVLVNNAGITKDVLFKNMSLSDWKSVIDTNLNSLYNVTHPLFGAMCNQNSGRIINISSVNGVKGQYGQTNYSAAKAGMIGFTKSLALEGARYGVTVNTVAPGYTATQMVKNMKIDVLDKIKKQVPLNRLATPEEIAMTVSFLAGKSGAYITGETISINGGLYMQ
ncbi:SDR family oxidoreductase [Vibrio sp. HN007]|uniref:SDR family oxidoreductase n=1 Tax=Vibrio iocasae TaxID=3098914 RepID=UPI0035D4450D